MREAVAEQIGVLTEVDHGDILTRNGMLLERKASSQKLDVGEGAGPERFFDGVGDFRFAAVFVGQGKKIDGETTRSSFAHGFLVVFQIHLSQMSRIIFGCNRRKTWLVMR